MAWIFQSTKILNYLLKLKDLSKIRDLPDPGECAEIPGNQF
jgi:hypothetical protein